MQASEARLTSASARWPRGAWCCCQVRRAALGLSSSGSCAQLHWHEPTVSHLHNSPILPPADKAVQEVTEMQYYFSISGECVFL